MKKARIRVLLMAGSMDGGGSERQTLLLLRHLDRRRFAPELYLSYRRGVLLDQVPDDVPIHGPDPQRASPRLNWPGRMHHRDVVELTALLRRRRIDVVYDRTFHMSLLAGPACRRSGVPHLSTIVTPDRFLPRMDRRFWRLKRRKLARAYRSAFRVLAVSDAVALDARASYALPADRVITIRNPVDLEALRQIALGGSPVSIDAGDFNVACVGRMTPEKGHAVLLSAAAQLLHTGHAGAASWRFWLFGDGPLQADLQRQAQTLGIAAQVRFCGYQSAAVAAVAACQTLASPSLFEGMPNVVLEAFTLGVPVVATRVDGTEELAGGGTRALLVPAGDAAALAAALQQVRDDPHAAVQRAAAARQAVEQEHALTKVVGQIEHWLTQATLNADGGAAAAGRAAAAECQPDANESKESGNRHAPHNRTDR